MTFSRRPVFRHHRGRIATAVGAAAPAVDTPASIMGANCVEWWRADLGNTIAADGNWVGQVAGTTFAQAVAGSRPTQNATGGPNSTPSMTLDGVDDSMQCALVRAAPGTTPAVIWGIIKQESWTVNEAMFSDAAGTFGVLMRTALPGIAMSAGTLTNLNNALAVGAWGRVQAYFANTPSVDELLLIATAASTATAAGNTAGTNPRIGLNGAGTLWAHFSLCEVAFFNAKPSAGQKTSLDAYVTARYGAGLV